METDIFLANKGETKTQRLHPTWLSVIPGIWIDGKTYWVRDSFEKIISEEAISIHMKESSIHSRTKIHDLFIRNHGKRKRNIKLLFIHHYPNVTKEMFSFISPAEKLIFHIKNDHIFLVNGHCKGISMEQMTIQPFWLVHTDLIWQSLEKGILEYRPMTKGITGSVFSLNAKIDVGETCKATTWMLFGHNKNELFQLNSVLKNTLAFPTKR